MVLHSKKPLFNKKKIPQTLLSDEIAQRVSTLVKERRPTFKFLAPLRKLSMTVLVTMALETGGQILGVHWLASLMETTGFRLREILSQKLTQRMRERQLSILLASHVLKWTFTPSSHWYTQPYIHTWVHTTNINNKAVVVWIWNVRLKTCMLKT